MISSSSIQKVSLYAGRKVAVLGLGRSGHTAAVALQTGGAEVLAWDDGTRPDNPPYPLVDLNQTDFSDIAALVISPGIPTLYPRPNPVAAKARAAGVPLISDVELLVASNPDARFIGITGTNGKSTCTALTAHLLQQAGQTVAMGGNIGVPALALPKLGKDGIYVLELSSYQLEIMQTPGIDAGLLLNISPDHLDRHGGMPGYIAAKLRLLTQLLKPQGQAIVALDNKHTRALAGQIPRLRAVSGYAAVNPGVYVDAGQLYEDGEAVADLRYAITLPGRHNGQNCAGAYALCRALGLAPAEIAPHFASFPGLIHRQERLGQQGRISFINDSKATNAEAAEQALLAFDNIHWLAGGQAKEEGITPLLDKLQNVAQAYLFGAAATEFQAQLQGIVPASCYPDLEQALNAAYQQAASAPDDQAATILLSPACASFDQFRSFEHRGEVFRDLVASLIHASGQA